MRKHALVIGAAFLPVIFGTGHAFGQGFSSCGQDICSQPTTARVAIGAAAPVDRLTIFGGTSNINIGGNYGSGYNGVWLNGGTAQNSYNLLSSAADQTLYINSPAALQFRILNNTKMILDSSGNLAIGTITAADRLTIFGGTSNINIGGNFGSGYNGIWLNGGTGNTNYNFLSSAADPTLYINTTATMQFRISNATRMILDGSGDVGIGPGTYTPVGRLDVRAATVLPSAGWGTEQLLSTDALAADKGGVLNFGGAFTSQGALTSWASIAGLKNNATDQDYAGYLAFYTRTNGLAPSERMRIDTNGVVSINGTTLGNDASDKLIVNGSIRAVAVIGATYQDVAEWVPASEPMLPGTVVVVDRNARNGIAPSQRAYDTAVAGVISSQPGVLLGAEGPSKVKVATTGRVKVRVDASREAIHAGDLLVTSDRAGFAMRSEPVDVGGVKMHRPGTLIGKALEPLESGQGEILVLLSLQ